MSRRRRHDTRERQPLLSAADQQPTRDRAVLLEVVTRVVNPSMLVLAVYLLLAGLHRPGGGFAAGLLVGLGLVLRRLAGGPSELRAAAPFPPGVLLGTGLSVVSSYGVAGFVLAGDPLKGHLWSLHLGVLGHVELAASLAFEVGILLIVVGLVLDVLRTLGAEPDVDPEANAGQDGAMP